MICIFTWGSVAFGAIWIFYWYCDYRLSHVNCHQWHDFTKKLLETPFYQARRVQIVFGNVCSLSALWCNIDRNENIAGRTTCYLIQPVLVMIMSTALDDNINDSLSMYIMKVSPITAQSNKSLLAFVILLL